MNTQRYISELEVVNFQAYRYAHIPLSPGINFFTGESDSGKSSLIRSVRLVAANRPISYTYKPHNSDKKTETTITITYNDDHWVARERSNKFNRYSIASGPLDALRGKVPEEVSEILNLDDTVNIQTQHSPYFMFTETPGQRAKMFNTVIGLDIMDQVLDTAKRKLRKLKVDITVSKDTRKALSVKIRKLARLKKFKQAVLELKEKQEVIVNLLLIQNKLIKAQTQQEELDRELHKTLLIAQALPTIQQLLKIKADINFLQGCLDTFTQLQDVSNELEELAEWSIFRVKIEKLLAINDERKQLTTIRNEILAVRTQIKANEEKTYKSIQKAKRARETRSAALKEMGICPTCGKEQ